MLTYVTCALIKCYAKVLISVFHLFILCVNTQSAYTMNILFCVS